MAIVLFAIFFNDGLSYTICAFQVITVSQFSVFNVIAIISYNLQRYGGGGIFNKLCHSEVCTLLKSLFRIFMIFYKTGSYVFFII